MTSSQFFVNSYFDTLGNRFSIYCKELPFSLIIFFIIISSFEVIFRMGSYTCFSSISCISKAKQAFFSKFLERTFQFLDKNSLQSFQEISYLSSFISCIYRMQNSGLAWIFSMILIRFSPAACNFLSQSHNYSRASSQASSFWSLNASTSSFQFLSNCSLLFIYYKSPMKSTYLDALRTLQTEHSNLPHRVSSFASYEDYLHQKSGLSRTIGPRQDYQYPIRSFLTGDAVINQAPPRKSSSPHLKIESKTTYYPVTRTEIDYKDSQYVERVPKTKKVVEYVEKKEVEVIPKQISKIDYYAVEHLRQYIKQTVPEVKIQTVKVPKTIKNIETIPVEKQIIYYPAHLTDMEEIKRNAKLVLDKQGVLIKQNAQYRPITEKNEIPSLKHNSEEQVAIEKGLPLPLKTTLTQNIIKDTATAVTPTFRLPRPQNRSKSPDRIFGSSTSHFKVTNSSPIPFFNKQKYDFKRRQLPSMSKEFSYDSLQTSGYTFAERDQYRYDLAMYNSAKRLNRW